jgi:CubicO group peptidase (beta-lactamase class C family)
VIVKGEPIQKRLLADRMAELKVPGVSIAVIRNGKIEWARGFGVNRMGGPPVTPDTVFQAASISKAVAALAAMRLVEQGKISLDTDVNGYLKTWKIPASPLLENSQVTLRGLLTHTAGMTVHGFHGYEAGAPIPTVVQILNGQPPANSPAVAVDTVLGSRRQYSGGGYTILQQMLSDVTGEPFPSLMERLVLKPAGELGDGQRRRNGGG